MNVFDLFAPYAAAQLYNRGTKALGEQQPAQRSLLASLACAPYTAQTWLNLGNALMAEGDAHAALGMYRRAMTLEPNHPRGAVNAAIALLTLGQWQEGWALYEQRFALPEFQLRNGLKGGDPSKMWRGESLDGKTLLVFNEQGIGDTLMCLRYGQSLLTEHQAGHVIYRVPASLLRLARANVVRESVVMDSEPIPAHDAIVPFMSLPGRCGKPTGHPYLRSPRSGGLVTRDITVGVCWAGSPHHPGDKRRSIAIEDFASLFSVNRVAFVSLQVGPSESDVAEYNVALPPHPKDYYDTAQIIKGLDLVVTVDTSVAHLAGALGVPCWVMLPFAADFRWMQHREDTPWYSSMRLFRQTTAGDWSSVIQRVQRGLELMVATRSAA